MGCTFLKRTSCFDILAGDQQCGNRGLLCGLRGKPHRELAEWTRAPAAFLEMSELPRTCLPIEDIEEISETQKERQKHDDEAMVLFSQWH